MKKDYRNKIIKLMKFKNFVLRHIIIIITSFVIFISGLTVFLMHIGSISNFEINKTELTYGDSIDITGSAFLRKINLEYREINDDTWIEGTPIYPATYSIRGYSNGLFNKKNYTEEKIINLHPKKIDLFINNNCIHYGDKNLDIGLNLIHNDRLENIEFDYDFNTDLSNINVMPIKNSIIIKNINDEDVTNCYDIGIKNKKMNFKKQLINIVSDTIYSEYNDSFVDNQHYHIINGKLQYEDKIIDNYKFNNIKDVCHLCNEAEFNIINKDGEDVTKFYDLIVDYGDINIYPRPLKITTGNKIASKKDGPIKNTNYEVFNLIEGHQLKLDRYTELSEVDTISNDLSFLVYDKQSNDVTKNYAFEYQYGKLTLCPHVTITTCSSEKEYDDTEFNFGFYEYSTKIPYNHHFVIKDLTSKVDAGVYDNIIELNVIDDLGNDVTKYYDLDYIYGKLTINPRKIQLISHSHKKMYDGLGYDYSIFDVDRLLPHHFVQIDEYYNLNPDVGIYENSFRFSIVDSYKNIKTQNYDVTTIWGNKEIYKRPLNIRSNDIHKIYDGISIFDDKYIIEEEGLVLDHKIKITKDFNSFIDAIRTINEFKCDICDSNGKNLTYNYDIIYHYGDVKIERRKVKVCTESFEKYYDKKEVYMPGYSIPEQIENEGLLSGDSLDVSTFKKFIYPGKYNNDFNYKITKNNNIDVTNNYELYGFGIINIKLHIINVTTGSSKKYYDGLPLTNDEIFFEDVDKTSVVIKGKTCGSIIKIGTTVNDYEAKVFKDGEDVTEFYEFNENLGTLEIEEYKGDDLVSGGKINSSGKIANEADKKLDDQKKKMGSAFSYVSDVNGPVYFRAFSFGDYERNKWGVAKEYKSSNVSPLYFASYALSKDYPLNHIKINLQKDMDYLLPYHTINGPKFDGDSNNGLNEYNIPYEFDFISYQYDAQDEIRVPFELSSEEMEYYKYVQETYLQLPKETKDEMLKIAIKNNLDINSPTIINDVQDYVQNAVEYNLDYDKFPDNCDMAVYFLNEAKNGICQHFASSAVCLYRALGIPARYTVGFMSRSKPYQKTDVSWEQCHAWVEIYIPGFGWKDIEVTGSDETNRFNPGFNPDFNSKETLTIKPQDLSKGYDGTPLVSNDEIDLDACPLLEDLIDRGYYYSAKCNGSITSYGKTNSTIESFTLFDFLGRDVTDKFNFSYLDGSLEITKRQAVFQIKSQTKYYDGKGITLTKNDVNVILPSGYNAYYDFYGKQENIGKSVATIKNVTIVDDFGNDVTDTFYIKIMGGRLKIKKIPITIKMNSQEKIYDGTYLKDSGFEIISGNLRDGDKINIISNSKILDIGEEKNKATSISIKDTYGKNVKFAYDIKLVYGKLVIVS